MPVRDVGSAVAAGLEDATTQFGHLEEKWRSTNYTPGGVIGA
ncbi:MAG: hypothetical protein WA988_10525 [Candidatus Nanopelagicales bacterium]